MPLPLPMAMPLPLSHGYATLTVPRLCHSHCPWLCHFHCPTAMPLPLPHGYATSTAPWLCHSCYRRWPLFIVLCVGCGFDDVVHSQPSGGDYQRGSVTTAERTEPSSDFINTSCSRQTTDSRLELMDIKHISILELMDIKHISILENSSHWSQWSELGGKVCMMHHLDTCIKTLLGVLLFLSYHQHMCHHMCHHMFMPTHSPIMCMR